MSIAKATAKSRWKGALLAAAGVGAFAPVAAKATLTVNLQFANGSTTFFATPATVNTDIPVFVYATVTGGIALTAPFAPGSTATPATTGNFDGLQYLYYNILNTNSVGAEVAGGIDTATLNSTLGFNGGNPQPNPNPGVVGVGAQSGNVVNSAPSGTTPGLSVGSFFNLSSSSTTSQIQTALAGIAKPRSNSPVFQNYSQSTTGSGGGTTYNAVGNDGVNIIVNSATSVSFLVETLYFKPSAFTASSLTNRVQTTLSVQVPNLSSVNLAGANWFQDNTVLNPGGQPQSTMNGNYSAGSSVTIINTLPGDANGDGVVNGLDLGALATFFGKTSGATYAQGDFNGDGAVNGLDLGTLATFFGQNLSPVSPELAAAPTFQDALQIAEAYDPAFAASVGTAAVPEPASLGLLAVAGVGLFVRRRSNRSK